MTRTEKIEELNRLERLASIAKDANREDYAAAARGLRAELDLEDALAKFEETGEAGLLVEARNHLRILLKEEERGKVTIAEAMETYGVDSDDVFVRLAPDENEKLVLSVTRKFDGQLVWRAYAE